MRLLVPARSDMWVVALAMNSLYGRLLDDGVQVFAYLPRILHAKTAIFDDRFTMIGSHNLDAFSWRFDLECNVVVDSTEFAESVRASFDHDLLESAPMDLSVWRERPAPLRFVAWFAALFRSFM